MAIEVVSVLPDGGILHHVPSQFDPTEQVMVTTSGPQRHGVWKVTNRATAGTTIITTPDAKGAIVVSDMIISTDKVANSSMALQFTDGTNTEIIALFDTANAPVSLAIGIVGLLRGWRDARLEIVTVSTVNATATLGYMKVPDGREFAEWDTDR
jgi:hypothetical protein